MITVEKSFMACMGKPNPIIRSFFQGREYVTLCLNAEPCDNVTEEIKEMIVGEDSNTDISDVFTYSKISIVNYGSHCSLSHLARIIREQEVSLSPSDLLFVAKTLGVESKDEMVDSLVRSRYSISEEFAIQRKAINNTDIEEFATYNSFVEESKELVKQALAL